MYSVTQFTADEVPKGHPLMVGLQRVGSDVRHPMTAYALAIGGQVQSLILSTQYRATAEPVRHIERYKGDHIHRPGGPSVDNAQLPQAGTMPPDA